MNIRLNDGRTHLWQRDTGVRVVMDEQCDCVQYSAQHLGATVDVENDPDAAGYIANRPGWYYYCGEMDLASGDSCCEIWIASGTTDNLTSRLTYKSYYR